MLLQHTPYHYYYMVSICICITNNKTKNGFASRNRLLIFNVEFSTASQEILVTESIDRDINSNFTEDCKNGLSHAFWTLRMTIWLYVAGHDSEIFGIILRWHVFMPAIEGVGPGDLQVWKRPASRLNFSESCQTFCLFVSWTIMICLQSRQKRVASTTLTKEVQNYRAGLSLFTSTVVWHAYPRNVAPLRGKARMLMTRRPLVKIFSPPSA